jgi:uncharacterized damage-inducible protein DinB
VNRADLLRLFAWDAWANRAALESIRGASLGASLGAASGAPRRALAIAAHLAGAGRLWLDRLHGDPPSIAVWPEFSIDQCAAALGELERGWTAYLGRLTDAELDRRVAYTNSKGERWENRVRDVLLHVTHHGGYHRGQIALLVRDSGAAPAYTDYIEAVRRGSVEE